MVATRGGTNDKREVGLGIYVSYIIKNNTSHYVIINYILIEINLTRTRFEKLRKSTYLQCFKCTKIYTRLVLDYWRISIAEWTKTQNH